MAINLIDVAKRVGVSGAAVSIYMNDPATKRVSAKTKEKIRKVINELNYRPNVIAKSLSSLKSYAVGILIPLDAPFFRSLFLDEILSGIQTVLFKKKYSLVFNPTIGVRSSQIAKEQLKRSQGYDGLILFGTRKCSIEDMRANVEELLKANVPFVLVNMPDLGYEANQVVNVTPKSSSAVRYLFVLGHERILLIAGSRKSPDTVEALREYRSAYEERGLPINEDLILFGDYEKAAAKSEVMRALSNNLNFTAVTCLNDHMALGAYEAIKERGLIVPDNVSVIGKGDYLFARHLNPSLTTIRIPMFEAGAKSAELLIRSIETGEPPQKIFLENELIARMSTSVNKK